MPPGAKVAIVDAAGCSVGLVLAVLDCDEGGSDATGSPPCSPPAGTAPCDAMDLQFFQRLGVSVDFAPATACLRRPPRLMSQPE